MIKPSYCRKCGARIPLDSLFCPTCGVSQTATDQVSRNQMQQNPSLIGTGRLPPGHVLHRRYRLVQTVGQGGMGAVYAAQDIQLGDRLVAVKEMSMHHLAPQEIPQAVEQFQREAYLLASLHHPNLPVIHEYFREAERWYLVMSFIEGRTLQAILDATSGNKLPVGEVVRIGVELCEVLDYLHTHKPQVIFRDLKPLNIMITPKGHICLIDFGIARHFKQDQMKDTAYYYSAGYAPPEQYGRSQTGPRSDIYSLGATLHQMASGHHPASKPFQFTPLQLVAPTFPVWLAQLIAQMLKMEEKDRPASVIEVKEGLVNLGQITPVQSGGQASGGSMTPAPSSFALITRPEAIEILRTFTEHTQNVLSVALSDDGRTLVSRSLDQTIRLWDVQNGKLLDTLTPRVLNRAEAKNIVTFSSVALSSDGRILAVGKSDKTIELRYAQTGKVPYNLSPSNDGEGDTGHVGAVTSLALNVDGRILTSGSLNYLIVQWNAQTRQFIHNLPNTGSVYHSSSSAVTSLALSADGLTLVSGSLDNTIILWNTQNGSGTRLGRHEEAIASVALSADGRVLASSSLDGTIKLWNAQKQGDPLSTLTGATKSMALNANGLILACADYNDGTIKLWNTQTEKLLCTHSLRTGSVSSVALSTDGRTLASGSSDGTVNVWGVKA